MLQLEGSIPMICEIQNICCDRSRIMILVKIVEIAKEEAIRNVDEDAYGIQYNSTIDYHYTSTQILYHNY